MKKELENGEIKEILDKMIEFEKSQKKPNIFKIILCIAASVAAIILLGTLCMIFYKDDFSIESLLSLLLAFFSIFISIFFYFKTDETSARFYDTSYNFMKDVSVTLGKIEERFGEKLNNLNDKISHLSDAKDETSEDLQSAEDEKQQIIDELMNKAQLNENEKKEFMKKLDEKEKETNFLKNRLNQIDLQYKKAMRENADLRHGITDNYSAILTPDIIMALKHRDFSKLSKYSYLSLKNDGVIDENDNITDKGYRIIKRSMMEYE